ncbi:MAG TPA: methionyl-tRNA formyltransferase [bacterium]|nr:methionyl-tRNA formyltransferase [bacterium]HEX67658.1 methionyl-tRNA formyltransferase [bacterium]
MRIVFMGSSTISLPSLHLLHSSGIEIALVVTAPDKPKGRGRKIGETPVKQMARELGLPIYQPTTLKSKEVIDKIGEYQPHVIVVVAYGKILPPELLKLPPKGCINLHPSLLPELRGPGAINWAIILGKEKTGVTTIFMDEGVDTGDIILQEEVEISPEDNSLTLSEKLAQRGAELLLKTLKLLEEGKAPRRPQIGFPSYAPLLTKETGKIDWRKSAKDIHNLVRGTIPWPTAYTFFKNKRMILWKTEVVEKDYPCQAGEVVEVSPEGIVVCAGKGAVKIKELQIEGKRRMRVKEFLPGYHLEKGVILGKEG